MNTWNTPATDQSISKTSQSLSLNGIHTIIVDTLDQAKQKVIEMVPEGAEVHTNTSLTLEKSGLNRLINESGKYNSTKMRLTRMDRKTDGSTMQKLGAGPDWALGSVHAVTEDGKVIIASGSGSNLPSYAYGAQHVIWLVGSQKLVKDLDQGMKRIYQHSLPLESKRAHKAYGVAGSNVRKLLIVNSEGTPNRITMIIIKQPIGF